MRRPTACEVENIPVETKELTRSGPFLVAEKYLVPSERDDLARDGSIEISVLTEEEQGAGVFVFPASLEQIRYWTLDQLDGDSTASNMAIAVRLEGNVDDQVVERAVQAVVERHEALRTTFQLVDGQLSQVISECARYNFAVTDLRNLPEAERLAAAEAAVEEHSHARADLAVGPAFFARLVHLDDRQHILAFTMHHIVCDGWSNGILTRDFTDLYAAFAQSREPALPELPFQFADFTVWQQNWLSSEAAEAALAFWRKHIRREMPAVDLPTDRPRLPQKSYPGHIESTLLSAELSSRLKAYCRAHNATMHQVLLAAFEGLISRYANQSEFLLGSTIANRTQPGMENVVGRFANPQVILADVQGDPSYSELLCRVIEWSTESYAHQDLPFSRLMEEFQLDQAGATSQFLQVYFVYQKAFMQPQEAQGLKVTPRPSVSGGVNFDLLVSIVERAEGPRLQMEYNTVIFRPERIQGLIAMYVRVLDAVMEDDTLVVSRFPLQLATMEQPAIAAETATKNHSVTPTVAEWLDRLAARVGTAPAIFEGEKPVSWVSLQEQSLAMASALRYRGITVGQVVALRMESSVAAAAAAWALLRIGAVALPIPATASDREWSTILTLYKPALALASSQFAVNIPGLKSYRELSAGGSPAALTYPPSDSPAWLAVSQAASGDAGEAFSSSHEAMLGNLLAAAGALDIRSGETVVVTPAQSSVDAWVDLFLPLVAGATVVYPSSPSELPATVGRLQASFLFTSAPELLQVVHDRWIGDRRLNVVVRGGILSQAHVQRISAIPLRLWALVSAPRSCGPVAIARVAGVEQPVFHALSGKKLLVLDDNDQPAPVGVFGELAVDSGAVNRTGLLARLATPVADGNSGDSAFGIEILDRSERLVRLHGYRLRLSELEEVLWQNTAIAEVVGAVLPVCGTDTLVAYFRPFPSAPGGVEGSVREHFRSMAPGMVASAELIEVGSIPRHADGSANLALLPAPGQVTSPSSEEYVPPRDELEASLVAIWEDVLGVHPIGIKTQFFKLGGYSLMIVRLFARINKVLGTSLPITTIFNAPTVEQLADIVRGRSYYSSLVPVRTTGSQSPFFMIHSYLLYQGIPTVLGDDVPFYGLRELETDAENMTVEQRAATYLDAIRSVQPHGPYVIGGWCAAGPLAVETARQITASGEKVSFLVLFDSWRPGYSAELARQQAGSKEMTFSARMGRKYRFHRNRWRALSTNQKAHYVAMAIGNKFASVRNRFYLKNWAMAEWFCGKFGLSLPHFMHNVSLTTLNSLSEYRGVEPYDGSLTLIRAKEAPYFPGAQEHCGWNSIVKGGVNIMWAPGDHESMFLEPHLHTVGELLRQSMAAAQSVEH